MRIVLADDHDLVRDGMRRIIEQHPDLEVVGEAADGKDLLDLVTTSAVDVVTMDISMPGPGFLETLHTLKERRPEVGVLVVTMHPEKEWAVQALKAGASGYLNKRYSSKELVEAIRRIDAGGVYVTPELGQSLASRVVKGGSELPHERLSRREFEVLCLLGEGLMIKTVGTRLGISPRTVSTYRTRILEKLDLQSTADLIRYAVTHQLVSTAE